MAREQLIPIKEAPAEISARSGGSIAPALDTVRAWCKTGLLTSRKIGGRVYVDAASIPTLLEGKEHTDANPDRR